MAHPVDHLARGLKLSHTAFRVTISLMALLMVMLLAAGVGGLSDFLRINRNAGYAYGGMLALVAIGAAAGMIAGFVGRSRCLATPEVWPVARTRIRLAVLLEGYGLLSGAVNGVVVVYNTWLFKLPEVVLVAVSASSVLALVLGRVLFLLFTRSLAGMLGDATLAGQSSRSLLLFVTVFACALGCVGLLEAMTQWTGLMGSAAGAGGGGAALAGGMIGLFGLFVYDRLLGRLRVAVSETSWMPVAEGVESEE